VKAQVRRSHLRNLVFSWPPIVFIQPKASSIRLRMRWLTAYPACRVCIGCDEQDRFRRSIPHGVQWLLYRHGPMASVVVEGGGFASSDGSGRPDVQIHIAPACQRRADAIFVEKGLRAGPMTLIRAADPLDLDHPACSF
jgi:hypothetical protein